MRPLGRLAGLLMLAAGFVTHGHAEEGPDEPVKLVRTLQLLHDQIAHGTLESEGARRALIDAISMRFMAADPDMWKNPRNVEAALLYVLSGGNPVVLTLLPNENSEPAHSADETAHGNNETAHGDEETAHDDDETAHGDDAAPYDDVDAGPGNLVAAVRAYVTGSEDEAKELWASIDLHSLPVSLLGPAALAKAVLLTKDDPQHALHFVDIARLESPGTLVEEAAVRRGIEIAAKLHDAERFEFFAIRYASRFPRSMYAEAFRSRFSEYFLAIATETEGETTPKLTEIVAPLADRDKREIFLEIARLAIIDGRIALGKSAAENAAALSTEGTVEIRRAQLYQATVEAIADPAAGRGKLEAVGAEDLPAGDGELLAAALTLVDEIHRWPEMTSNQEPPAAEPVAETSEESPPSVDVAARAQEALVAAKQLLSDAGS